MVSEPAAALASAKLSYHWRIPRWQPGRPALVPDPPTGAGRRHTIQPSHGYVTQKSRPASAPWPWRCLPPRRKQR